MVMDITHYDPCLPKIRNANSPEFSMSLVVLTKATAEAIIYANSEAF